MTVFRASRSATGRQARRAWPENLDALQRLAGPSFRYEVKSRSSSNPGLAAHRRSPHWWIKLSCRNGPSDGSPAPRRSVVPGGSPELELSPFRPEVASTPRLRIRARLSENRSWPRGSRVEAAAVAARRTPLASRRARFGRQCHSGCRGEHDKWSVAARTVQQPRRMLASREGMVGGCKSCGAASCTQRLAPLGRSPSRSHLRL